jgi:AMMECR1 domain-containing protein
MLKQLRQREWDADLAGIGILIEQMAEWDAQIRNSAAAALANPCFSNMIADD